MWITIRSRIKIADSLVSWAAKENQVLRKHFSCFLWVILDINLKGNLSLWQLAPIPLLLTSKSSFKLTLKSHTQMGAFISSPLMLSLFSRWTKTPSVSLKIISPALRPSGPFDSSAAGNQTTRSTLQLAWLEICYQIIHTHVHSVHAQHPFSVWLNLLKALSGSVQVPSRSGLGVLLFVTVLLPPLPQGLGTWEFITSPVSCLSLYSEKPVTRYPCIPHIFRITWEKKPIKLIR